MKSIFVVGTASLCVAGNCIAAPLLIVECAPPKGVNLAPGVERNRPKDSIPEVFDAAAGGYLSNPRNTRHFNITINGDGTATETEFLDNHTSLVVRLRIVGKLNNQAISYVDGHDGSVDLLTLYPKEGIAVSTGTSYVGWYKAIPTGYVYLSHCEFSWVINQGKPTQR